VIMTFFLVLLIGLHKELDVNVALRGSTHLGLRVIALCTFIALLAVYIRRNKSLCRKLHPRTWIPHVNNRHFIPANRQHSTTA
jgi:hypothetical protein